MGRSTHCLEEVKPGDLGSAAGTSPNVRRRGAARIGRKLGVVVMREVEINSEPGCVFEDGDGRAIAVVALNIADDQVQTIHAVANPEKLRHLGRSD